MLRPVSRVPAKLLEALAPRDAGEHREAAEIAPEENHNAPLYNTKNGPGGRDESTLADLGGFVGFKQLAKGIKKRLESARFWAIASGSFLRDDDRIYRA